MPARNRTDPTNLCDRVRVDCGATSRRHPVTASMHGTTFLFSLQGVGGVKHRISRQFWVAASYLPAWLYTASFGAILVLIRKVAVGYSCKLC